MMLNGSGNQYLRPEYLTPLPTTLDAKKSPLALLAQTCSQIGADPPHKLLESKKKDREKSKSPETDEGKSSQAPPLSAAAPRRRRSGGGGGGGADEDIEEPPAKLSRPPSRKCPSSDGGGGGGRKSSTELSKSPSPPPPPSSTTTSSVPPSSSSTTVSSSPSNSIGEPVAFKWVPPTLPMDLLMGRTSYPAYPYSTTPTTTIASRICRDPYCQGCTATTTTTNLPYATPTATPYACSWICQDATYCGKRFSTSDELLVHLRTHTSGIMVSATPPTTTALDLIGAGGLARCWYPVPTTPTPFRYHPYGKPLTTTSSAAFLPPPPPFFHPSYWGLYGSGGRMPP